MSKKRSAEQESNIKRAIILIAIVFLAVGAYYSLQEEQTVYAPIKTYESPVSAGTAEPTSTRTSTLTVTATTTPPPIPTTAKPTATPPPVPTVTEATPPPTPLVTSQTPVQTPLQPTPAQTQANKASYISSNFQSGDIRGPRITVPQGNSVDSYVVLTGSGSGTLKTEVKRDLSGFPWKSDDVLTTFYNQIVLNGEQTVKVGTFSANDLSGQNSFRQYFIKLYWNDKTIFDPTDENSRPAVITSAQTIEQPYVAPATPTYIISNSANPKIAKVVWYTEKEYAETLTSLPPNTQSYVRVYFTSPVSSDGTGTYYEGPLYIHVRQNRAWSGDLMLINQGLNHFRIDSNEKYSRYIDASFLSPSGNSVFIRIDNDESSQYGDNSYIFDESETLRRAIGAEIDIK